MLYLLGIVNEQGIAMARTGEVLLLFISDEFRLLSNNQRLGGAHAWKENSAISIRQIPQVLFLLQSIP